MMRTLALIEAEKLYETSTSDAIALVDRNGGFEGAPLELTVFDLAMTPVPRVHARVSGLTGAAIKVDNGQR